MLILTKKGKTARDNPKESVRGSSYDTDAKLSPCCICNHGIIKKTPLLSVLVHLVAFYHRYLYFGKKKSENFIICRDHEIISTVVCKHTGLKLSATPLRRASCSFNPPDQPPLISVQTEEKLCVQHQHLISEQLMSL